MYRVKKGNGGKERPVSSNIVKQEMQKNMIANLGDIDLAWKREGN